MFFIFSLIGFESFSEEYKKIKFSNFIKNKLHYLYINCISLKDDFKLIGNNVLYFKLYNSYGACSSDIKNDRSRSEIRSGKIDSKKNIIKTRFTFNRFLKTLLKDLKLYKKAKKINFK